jgi:hypothetical protein
MLRKKLEKHATVNMGIAGAGQMCGGSILTE